MQKPIRTEKESEKITNFKCLVNNVMVSKINLTVNLSKMVWARTQRTSD